MAICTYFLYEILGYAAFTGTAILLLMVPLNVYVAGKLKYFQVKQMKKKDQRVRTMNEILSGMKVLKLYAWEPSFEKSIEVIREKELQIIRNAAVANAFVFFIWNIAPFLVTVVSFATFMFIDENNQITPNTVFVSLSLFNILRVPMNMFPLMISQMTQAWVSVKRINSFLNSEDLDTESVENKSDRKLKKKTFRVRQCYQKLIFKLLANALKVSDGSFSWGDGELVLKNVNLNVGKGELAAVVGPVGCGKTSLISSILGETDRISGGVNIDGTVAYVAQQAWIQNATLRVSKKFVFSNIIQF